jgi:hypothetical protein
LAADFDFHRATIFDNANTNNASFEHDDTVAEGSPRIGVVHDMKSACLDQGRERGLNITKDWIPSP